MTPFRTRNRIAPQLLLLLPIRLQRGQRESLRMISFPTKSRIGLPQIRFPTKNRIDRLFLIRFL